MPLQRDAIAGCPTARPAAVRGSRSLTYKLRCGGDETAPLQVQAHVAGDEGSLSMRDEERRSPLHQTVHRCEEDGFVPRVARPGWLVADQDRRVLGARRLQPSASPLAARAARP